MLPGLNNNGEIRLYGNADGGNEITVKLLNGSTINSIHISFADVSNYRNVYVKVDGTAVTASNGEYQINSTSFVVGNANTSSTQVRFNWIAIDYTAETAAVATPVITLDPANGPYYEGTSVKAKITCATDGALIYYARNDGDWTLGNELTVTATTTIKARAVYLDQESAVASKTVTFVPPVTTVNSIAQFNALPDGTDVIFGIPVNTIKQKDDYLYVQDDSNGMLIYGPVGGYVYSHGDVVHATFRGKKTTYKGAPELIPDASTFIAPYSSVAMTPVELTPAQVNLDNVLRYAVIRRATISDNKIVVGDESVAIYNGRFNTTLPTDTEASMGPTVTLTVTPDENYELESIAVTTVDAQETEPSGAPRKAAENIELTKTGDNTYTFTMPASNVNVIATFKEEQVTAIGDIKADSHNGLRYVNPMGQVSNRPFQGLNIVIDGNKTYKIIK